MAAYPCWQDVLDDVTNRIRKNKAILRFAKLKSDEDRVDFCLKDDIIRTKVLQWLNIMSSSRHKKYWEKAAELRAEGNLCFQEKEYEKAVEFYTQSILAAPFPDSEEAGSHVEELSLGFGNRSAALFHLHKYEPCLEDVHRAIQYNYPRDLRFKLLQRKGQCHMKLNQPDLAVQAFDESLELLEESRLDSRRIVRQKKEIENLKNMAIAMEQSSHENAKVEEENRVPPLSYGIHPTIASASSAVDMMYDKTKGRYIVANRQINAGDTLFVEIPYASVLLPGHYSSHCHHCYVKTQAVIPCHKCSQVRYCCQECCDESWEKYHKWECGNLDLLHTVGVGHLCCRLVLITGLSQMQVLRDQLAKLTDSVEPPGCLDGGYYGNCYFSVYHLVTHAEDRHVEDTFQYAMTALLLLLLLDKLNFFATLENPTLRERLVSCSNLSTKVNSAPSTPTHKSRSPVHSRISVASIDDSDVSSGPCTPELFVGGVLLRHILQMVCNASAITELQVSPMSGEGGHVLSQRQVRVATGIFPSASLMNHSCNPSVISSFYKNTLIVRAVNNLESGSPVFNCYGPHYRRMPREDRQRALLEQYFFLCECDACVNEDDREQKFQALKCTYCTGPLRAPDTSNRTSCMDCDKDQDCAGQLQKVFTAHDLFVQGLQLAARGNFKDAIERLKRCHRMREKVMYQYNRQLAEVQDQLACCYASLGKMVLAVEYLRPTLVTTENIYGTNSIELANELQKYSDLLLNAIAQLSKEGISYSQELRSLMEEAEAVLDRACHIFSIHYGLHHIAVHELKEKKLQLKAFEI